MKDEKAKEISVYVHIPFCEKKCNYCAFHSFCASDDLIEKYVDALCKEISLRSKNFADCTVSTIYFGGGTPSVLSCKQFEKIANAVFQNFSVAKDAEFSVEANPNSLTYEKLQTFKACRVNRISLGVQSLSDKSLAKIGRLHSKDEAQKAVSLARKLFLNVSCDLIVGLENEDGKTLCKYAKILLDLGVKHISCYLLELYENTPLFQMVKNNAYHPLSDEKTVEAFSKLSNFLQDHGFERYEISNFALPGFESRHNLAYWQRKTYVGFGLAAHSFDGKNQRRENATNFEDYFQGKFNLETLGQKEIVEEKIMLGLRCNIGVNVEDCLPYDLRKNAFFEEYERQGILKESDGVVRLNPMFYHLSNTIIANLLP